MWNCIRHTNLSYALWGQARLLNAVHDIGLEMYLHATATSKCEIATEGTIDPPKSVIPFDFGLADLRC